MATIIRVQGNRLELAIPLQTVTMTPNGKVTEDYNVPADAEVKVVLSSSWKTYGFEPLSISGNVVTIRDDGKLPVGKYAVEVRIRQADGTPLRSKYCNIIDIRDCNDGVTQEYDDFIEGSVTLDAQIFWFAKGDDGITPHIDETTGNWFVGDTDTGVHAQGEPGATDYNDLENKPDLTIYQEKETGKGLSTNDYTTEEKQKLAGLENYDDTNVLNLIEQTNQNFANYYTKQQTYSQSEVNSLLEAQLQGEFVSVLTLPEASPLTMFKIYLVPKADAEEGNERDEYITIQQMSRKPSGQTVVTYKWEHIGDTKCDLSGYVTTTALNTALADYTTTANLTTLLAGKQDKIDSSHKLSADLVDDTNTTNKFTNATEKQTWNNKQDALVSGTNIKTINNESVLGGGNINIVTELPNNLAYTSNDNGEGIIPSDGIRAVTVTSAAAMTINPDVVTIIDGAVGTAAITLQVPQDNLAHVWDILMTTDSTVAITFAMSNSATILTPSGFSIGASKAVEISVIGVGTKYYLRYGEFA